MKGDRTYLISVEHGDQILAASTFTRSRDYIWALCAIARYLDENMMGCIIRVLPPPRYPPKIFEGQDIKNFANAARYAGISCEES